MEQRSGRQPLVLRRRTVVTLGLALVAFVLCGLLASDGLVWGEVAVFTAVNSLSDALYVVIWPFMQFGVFVTIPILVVVALVLHRVRLAGLMAVSGVGVYLLARVAKDLVERGRPGALLAGVSAREPFSPGGLGFPSGHAAVAAALMIVMLPYLPPRWRWLPVALLVLVMFGRMYVGAHLPLDLIGGAALGVAAGSLAQLVVGQLTSARVVQMRDEQIG